MNSEEIQGEVFYHDSEELAKDEDFVSEHGEATGVNFIRDTLLPGTFIDLLKLVLRIFNGIKTRLW